MDVLQISDGTCQDIGMIGSLDISRISKDIHKTFIEYPKRYLWDIPGTSCGYIIDMPGTFCVYFYILSRYL